MKNVFFLLIFLIPVICFSQTNPSYQYIGTPTNIVKTRGGSMSDSANYLPIFNSLSDTLGLTTYDRLGDIIFIRNISQIYYRDSISGGGHKWTQLLNSSNIVSANNGLINNSNVIQLGNANNSTTGQFTTTRYIPFNNNSLYFRGNKTNAGNPYLVFDDTLTASPGNQKTRNLIQFNSLDHVGPGFYFGDASTDDGTSKNNQTWNFGINLSPSSTRINSTFGALGWSMEGNFQGLQEWHQLWIDKHNKQYRISSFTIDTTTKDIDYFNTVSRHYWKRPSDNQIYANLTQASGGGQLRLLTNNNYVELSIDSVQNSGFITANIPLDFLYITNFNNWQFPNLASLNGNVGVGTTTPPQKFNVQLNTNAVDGIEVINSNSGISARPMVRVKNNINEVGVLSIASSAHPSLANVVLLESTKGMQIATDQGIASGGSGVINFITGGYSIAPSLIIKNTGTINASSLAGSGTRMVVASATGDLSTQTIGNTLYTGDGIADNRTVTVTGSTMTVTSALTTPTPTLTVNNTSSGHGVLGSASGAGYGVYGSGFRGVYGTGTGGGTGVYGQETSGIGVRSVVTTGTSLQVDHTPTSANDVQLGMRISRFTSGNSGLGQSGIGTYVSFAAPTTTQTAAIEGGAIQWLWSDATNATKTSRFNLQLVNNGGALATVATFDGNANATFGTTNSIVGTATNNNAVAGNIGEEINAYLSTYTNYTTSATYQAIDSITLTAGDWDLTAQATFSANSATLTVGSDAIFVISTTRASAAGSTEGKNIAYVPQTATGATNHESVTIAPYRVSLSSTTTYYLNSQATFTVGNPQFTGGLRGRRMR